MTEDPAAHIARPLDAGSDQAAGTSTPQGARGALEEWNRELEARIRRGVPRARAASILARERPDLRRAMLEEANRGRRGKRR